MTLENSQLRTELQDMTDKVKTSALMNAVWGTVFKVLINVVFKNSRFVSSLEFLV